MWLVERRVGIISEASRHLTEDLKARHPEIPWQKVAGIGNVLRHNYESIAAPIIWKLAQADLPLLEKVNGAGPQTARLIVATHARGRGFISSGCGWIALPRSGQPRLQKRIRQANDAQSAICE